MLRTGIGTLQSRTEYYPTFIRHLQKRPTRLTLDRFLVYSAVSLNSSVHPPPPFFPRKRATIKRPQWKSSLLDNLDAPDRKTEGISPPQNLKLSNLSENNVPNEPADAFSPLPIPPDLKCQSDADADSGTLLDESFIDNTASDIQNIPNVELDEFEKEEDCLDQRARLLRAIRGGKSFEDSWIAYTCLLELQKSYGNDDLPVTPFIPHHYLHFLAGRLAKMQAAGRQHFFRLLSVLTSLRTTNGSIFIWEWNSLIHCSAKSFRKTTVEDYRVAIGILKDMIQSASVLEENLRRNAGLSDDDDLPEELDKTIVRPDIVTYTTLLAIASRTGDPSAVQHALSLLRETGLPWIARTHTAMLPYYMHTGQFEAFPRVLVASLPNDLTITLVTRIIWAYAYKGRMRIAMQLYDFLRGNIPSEDKLHFEEPPQGSFGLDSKSTFSSDDAVGNPILSIPGFIDHATMSPNGVTYCMMIQALCYHGDLIGAFIIFRDMLSTVRTNDRPVHVRDFYKPRPSIYRSFFLGFARHAGGIRTSLSQSLMLRDYEIDKMPLPEFAARLTATPRGLATAVHQEKLSVESPWSLENLEIIFEAFLEMDWEASRAEEENGPTEYLSDRTIYWIMVSFAKVTNNDWYKLYSVWTRLDKQFGLDQYRLSKRLREMRDYLVEKFGHLADTVEENKEEEI